MYKNNSGLLAKTEVSKYIKGLFNRKVSAFNSATAHTKNRCREFKINSIRNKL